MIKIKSMCVALNLFCFGHFFPIPKISTPAKVIVAAIHSARATAAKLEIMDGFAFDDISTFFASDCVPDNSRHNQSLFSAFLIFSFPHCRLYGGAAAERHTFPRWSSSSYLALPVCSRPYGRQCRLFRWPARGAYPSD